MQIDIRQRFFPLFPLQTFSRLICEAHMVKINPAVRNFFDRIPGIFHIRHLCQYLRNSPAAGRAHGHHDKNHGQHHKGHHYTHYIAEHGCELSGGQISRYHKPGSEPGKKKNTAVNHQHHRRIVEGKNPFRLCKQQVQVLCCPGKFLIFIIFPYIRFHNPDSGNIFLDTGV